MAWSDKKGCWLSWSGSDLMQSFYGWWDNYSHCFRSEAQKVLDFLRRCRVSIFPFWSCPKTCVVARNSFSRSFLVEPLLVCEMEQSSDEVRTIIHPAHELPNDISIGHRQFARRHFVHSLQLLVRFEMSHVELSWPGRDRTMHSMRRRGSGIE